MRGAMTHGVVLRHRDNFTFTFRVYFSIRIMNHNPEPVILVLSFAFSVQSSFPYESVDSAVWVRNLASDFEGGTQTEGF
jgi:hypothetical protein